jgi:hypothetical protein
MLRKRVSPGIFSFYRRFGVKKKTSESEGFDHSPSFFFERRSGGVKKKDKKTSEGFFDHTS